MSAVATILGLLIVVTFIASYLTTTLPNTMGQNDLQHDVQVQNQLAELSGLLQATAQSLSVGAQVSAPVTLGSASAPPFAGQDSAAISAGNLSGGMKVNFTLVGPYTYNTPTGGPSGGSISGSGCISSSNSITCTTTAGSIVYNFTGTLGGQSSYTITLEEGGTALINISASHSSITFAGSLNPLVVLNVLGSNDTVSLTATSNPESVLIFGSGDTLTLTGAATNSVTRVVVVGNHDTVTTLTLTGGNTVIASVYGSNDAVNPGTLSGSSKFSVYFNGFNPSSPSIRCPVDNLSSSDTVSQPVGGSGPFTVTYNNTVYSGSGTNGDWTVSYQTPTLFLCPFVTQLILGLPGSGSAKSAAFVVQLRNTYSPSATVAFDQGAVVYVQPQSIPIFVVPPRVSYVRGVLSIFMPRFANAVGAESGVGTADISGRLLSATQLQLPGAGFILQNLSRVTITVITPFAAAWYTYFLDYPGFSSSWVSCTGSNSVCTGLWNPGGPLGTVTVHIPATGLTLQVLVGVYSVNVS